jgi:hypothetical protein
MNVFQQIQKALITETVFLQESFETIYLDK